ncbi:MAG: chemotaxis protein CheX [Ghiorsea sp.]
MIVNEDQRDILAEIVNTGIGRAAAALNDMVGHKIHLNVPVVEVIDEEALRKKWLEADDSPISSVLMEFDGSFSGNAALVFPPDSASVLVSALTDESPVAGEMDALRMGTLTEVGNILINGVIGSIGNSLNASMGFSLPTYIEGKLAELINHTQHKNTTVLVANTTFSIDELKVKGEFILFFELASFKDLLVVINRELAL